MYAEAKTGLVGTDYLMMSCGARECAVHIMSTRTVLIITLTSQKCWLVAIGLEHVWVGVRLLLLHLTLLWHMLHNLCPIPSTSATAKRFLN